MHLRVVSVFIGIAALISLQSAFACSCVWRNPSVPSTDPIVIRAKVTKLATKPVGAGPWDVTLVVVKSWRGPWRPHAILQVQTPGPSGACGFFIHVGDEMLVYADDPSTMNLALCNTVRGDAMAPYIRTLDQASPNGVAG